VETLGWWFDYFDQVNAWGVMDASAVLGEMSGARPPGPPVSGEEQPPTYNPRVEFTPPLVHDTQPQGDAMQGVALAVGELTKVAFRLPWMLPLFGGQQVVNMLTPRTESGTSKAAQVLNRFLNEAYTALEAVQANVVDPVVGGIVGMGSQPSPEGRTTGWGPMPHPVIVPSEQPSQLAPRLEISADYPFESHYIDVYGSKIHYIEVGVGNPILILHGNPTWSYIWRNIIPYLKPLGRCIAPDLIGFGRSDKPNIAYRWTDHVRYLEKFIEKMNLRNMILVLHDQGSSLGFHYAMRHEQNVQGLAFFEALMQPYTWENFSTPEFRELFRVFRTGGIGGEGWQLLVEQNAFIEQLLPQAAGRPLSEVEMEHYREPFINRDSRLPIWQFPRDTPIEGEPPDVWQAVSTYSQRLQASMLPKLLLYAEPGALVTASHLDWAQRNLPNLNTVYVGRGSHFLQESSPHQIGREIARWIANLRECG
jgi:haloalkane dehalogenase